MAKLRAALGPSRRACSSDAERRALSAVPPALPFPRAAQLAGGEDRLVVGVKRSTVSMWRIRGVPARVLLPLLERERGDVRVPAGVRALLAELTRNGDGLSVTQRRQLAARHAAFARGRLRELEDYRRFVESSATSPRPRRRR